jgi:putative membrane protein
MHPYDWTVPLEALALVPLAVGYALGIRRHPAEPARVLAFVLGLALLLGVLVTPVHALAMNYLLSMHLLQNVVLAEWAPALCVLAVPPALAAVIARRPGVRFLTAPLVALPLWLGTSFFWHVPAVYDAALRRPETLLHVEHLCFFASGCLLWWPVFQDAPRALRSGTRALYLFAAFVLASPLGLLLALVPRAVYDFYVEAPRIWGLSALADQQLAGLTMATEQAVVFFAAFTVYFMRFLQEEEPIFEPHRIR